jgi:diguanylate cyclase (GGDEF)-like protein
MYKGGPDSAPASRPGRGDGRRFDSLAYLRLSKFTIITGLVLLAAMLTMAPPTAPLQCGYILLTAIFCWHSSKSWGRGVMTTSALVLVLSAWLHREQWDAYLLGPMAFIAGEGMIRLRMRYDEVEMAANVDRLTGAMTPRGFTKMLGRELRIARAQARTTALIFLDLDHFKQVNDLYGHAEGDRVLSRVVAALREVLLDDDHIARLGGDEFLVFLRFADDRSRLDEFQQSLVGAIDRLPWQVSASAGGIIVPPNEYPDPGSLVRLADNLMYDVKRSGRGRLDLQHLSDLDGSATRLARTADGTQKLEFPRSVDV